jgi:hypothetical protein
MDLDLNLQVRVVGEGDALDRDASTEADGGAGLETAADDRDGQLIAGAGVIRIAGVD